MFSAGFQCSWLVFGVLGQFLGFSVGFQCSLPVWGVPGWFWLFSAGFGYSRLVFGVLGLAIQLSLTLCILCIPTSLGFNAAVERVGGHSEARKSRFEALGTRTGPDKG